MGKNKTLEAIVSIAGQLDPSLQKSLSDATKQFSGLKIGLAAVGTAAVAGTAAVVKLGSDAVKSAAEYQKQMANVSTLLDGTTAEVDKRVGELSQQMLEVSNTTGVATDDLTDGLYNMISAVGDSADVSKQVELAAKAAAAGGATTTDSINLLSAVTKAYGDTSFDAMSKVSDLAFNTVKLGQTTFPELASSIQQVTGASNTLGVSQEELFGVFATATGVTGETSTVATQLKAVYSNLEKPSTAMAEALKSIGFESGQAAIQQLGLQGTLDALADSCGGDVSAMAQMFGSVEGLNLVLGLTGDLSDALTTKTQAMYEATGMTEEAFGKQTNTLEYMVSSIKNVGNNFLTSIGMKILPVVQDVASKLLPAITTGLDNISPVIDTIFQSLSPVITGFGSFVESILPSMQSGLEGSQNIWSQMQPTLQILTDSILPPLQDLFGNISNIFVQLQPVVSDFVSNLIPNIGQLIQSLAPIFSILIQNLSPILEMAGQLVSHLLPAITQLINFLMPIIQLLASIIAQTLGNAFSIVLPIIQNVINIIKGLCDFITNVFTGNWSAAWENVKSIFSNAFQALVGLVKTPINAVIGIINGAISGINACGFTIPDWVPVLGGKDFRIDIPEIPMLAKGGFTTGPSIAGEAGMEAVISFDKSQREENLSYWAKAGRMLGVNDLMMSAFEGGSGGGGNQISFTFAPQITIQGTGSDKNDIISAIRDEEEEFMDMVEEMMGRRGGDNYEFSY